MSKFIPNSFQVPNAFVDAALCQLSPNAVKVYLVVVRKTRGWQKESDKISYSQLKTMSGIGSYTTIEKAVSELETLGLVTVERGTKHQSNTFSINDGDIKDYRNCSTTETVAPSRITETVAVGTTETVALGTTETVDTENNTLKTTKNKKSVTPTANDWLKELGCDDQLASDFVAHRKAKKAAITQTVLKLIASQAEKAGISFARAIEITIARDWKSFNASWKWQDDQPAAPKADKWAALKNLDQPRTIEGIAHDYHH